MVWPSEELRTFLIQDDRAQCSASSRRFCTLRQKPASGGTSASSSSRADTLGLGQNLAVEEKEHAGEAENYRAIHDVTLIRSESEPPGSGGEFPYRRSGSTINWQYPEPAIPS